MKRGNEENITAVRSFWFFNKPYSLAKKYRGMAKAISFANRFLPIAIKKVHPKIINTPIPADLICPFNIACRIENTTPIIIRKLPILMPAITNLKKPEIQSF